jgi:uncharacterized protein YjiS (DUF1127 family)
MFNASQRVWPCTSLIIAVKSAFGECTGSFEAWRLAKTRNWEKQRAIRHLLSLDDRLLDDVGLTRPGLMAELRRRPITR